MAKLTMQKELEILFTSLSQQPEVWTPSCIATEDMIALVERGGQYSGAPKLVNHMLTCTFCRQTYHDLEAMSMEEERERGQQEGLHLLLPGSDFAVYEGLNWKPGEEGFFSLSQKSGELFCTPADSSLLQRLGAPSAEILRWEEELPLPHLDDVPDGLICYLALEQEHGQYFLEMSLGRPEETWAGLGVVLNEQVEIIIRRLSKSNKSRETLQAHLSMSNSWHQSILNYSKKETWEFSVRAVKGNTGNALKA